MVHWMSRVCTKCGIVIRCYCTRLFYWVGYPPLFVRKNSCFMARLMGKYALTLVLSVDLLYPNHTFKKSSYILLNNTETFNSFQKSWLRAIMQGYVCSMSYGSTGLSRQEWSITTPMKIVSISDQAASEILAMGLCPSRLSDLYMWVNV